MLRPASAAPLATIFRRLPDLSFFLLGILWTFLVMPASPRNMVTDSFRRFRSAAWIWSGENPGGRLPGLDGFGHHWDGVGQSLLFVPFDMGISALGARDIATRYSIMARVLFPLVNGLVLFLSWHALRLLGFKPRIASIGTLVTLACSTLTFHFQNNQENPLMLAYALAALIGILRWSESGSLAWLNLACAAQAGSISIRITNLAYVLPLFGIPMLTRMFDPTKPWDWRDEIRRFAKLAIVAIPWLLLALAIDRWWQWIRFGTLKGTYYSVFKEWATTHFENLPAGFPFSVPFSEGFWGQLSSPAKGVVFYEPIIAASLLLWLLTREKANARTKALVVAGAVACIGTAFGLARLYYWDSDPNWGPRYLATPAHLVELPLAAWMASTLRQRTWLRRLMICGALCLLAFQTSGIWLPAYHENIVRSSKRNPEEARRASEYWSRGLPTVDAESHQDWVVVNRPVDVATDIARQLTLPTDQWMAGNPPMRMIWITGTLKSLSPPVRWVIRLAWLAGLGLALWLARQSILGDTEPGHARNPSSVD